jgi:AcrR family transcriptional regulator
MAAIVALAMTSCSDDDNSPSVEGELSIYINGEHYVINLSDNGPTNLTTLCTEFDADVTVGNSSDFQSIIIDGQTVKGGKCKVPVSKINADTQIKIAYLKNGRPGQVLLNTLHSGIPKLNVNGQAVAKGDFYLSFVYNRLIMKVNNKEKIFNVSIDLFSKYGFDGVSVRQIAGEVGIKESSIYNHYPNKQAILNSILDYYIAEMTSEEIPLNQASLNLDMGFDFFYRAGCDAFLSKLKEDRMMKITRLLFIESYHNDEVREFLKKSIIEAPIEGWVVLFNLMKSKNMIREDCDVRQLSQSFFYYGMFLLYEHFFINYPEDDMRFLEEFMIKTEKHARIIFDSVKIGGDKHEDKA